MKYAVLVDFGSTYTKLTCVNILEKKVVHTDKYPSTVNIDAEIGMQQCFQSAKKAMGKDNFSSSLKLASSSAAGGLRMAVIGLSRTLSIVAGKNAAFGAGAKIIKNCFGTLTPKDITDLETNDIEIIVLCGGYEKGNRLTVLENAELLSKSSITAAIIYAGNSDIAMNVREILAHGCKECFLVENLIPNVGKINTHPTELVIRDLFMKRIINMKGIGIIREQFGGNIVPTPAAVLAAGTLLSKGTSLIDGMGSLILVDIGGATSDIYSFIENKGFCGAKMIGAFEPYSKRTVEGDMGMRESSVCLLKEIGVQTLSTEANVSEEYFEKAIQNRTLNTSYLAETEQEIFIDNVIACKAVHVSTRRHVGRIESVYSNSISKVQLGKNLTEVTMVVGTGGVIVNSKFAQLILSEVASHENESEDILLPKNINTFIDNDYILYAAGLLSEYDEPAAFQIMEESINLKNK